MALLAIYYVAIPTLIPLVLGGYDHVSWDYNVGQTMLSYFNTGFARRELQGTLLAFIPGSRVLSMLGMHVAAYAVFTGVLIRMVSRREPGLQRIVLAAVCLGLLSRVVGDVGRVDMQVMVCGLLGLWAARAGRWMAAAASIGVALAFHETGYICLCPALAVAALESGSWRNWRSASAVGGLLIVLASLGAYGVAYADHPDVLRVSREVHASLLQPAPMGDLAVYFNLAGFRNITAAMCEIRMDPNFPINFVSGAALLAGMAFVLRPGRWLVSFTAALLPYLCLSLIALDLGRWMVFGVFIILSLALADPDQPETFTAKRLAMAIALVAAITVLAGRRAVFTPVPAIDFVAQRIGHQTLGPIPAMDQCDPSWRHFLGLPT